MQIKSLKINILTKKNKTVLKTKSRKKNLPTMTRINPSLIVKLFY